MKTASMLLLAGAVLIGNISVQAEPPTDRWKQAMEVRYLPLSFMPSVFSGDQFPACEFVNPEQARTLLGDYQISVTYYDAEHREVETPGRAGRYGAVVTIAGADDRKLTRYRTLYRSPGDFGRWAPPLEAEVAFPEPLGIAPEPAMKQREQISRYLSGALVRDIFRTDDLAVLLAGLHETNPDASAADVMSDARVQNRAWWLALSRKLNGNAERFAHVKLPTPRTLQESPARVLRSGSLAEAGMKPDAQERIEEVLSAWARDTDEPFVVCVARHGVIVHHQAYSVDGRAPVELETVSPVASITKALSGALLMMFVDRELVALDAPVEKYLPEFAQVEPPKSATLRHLFTHTAGMESHSGDGLVDLEQIYGGGTYPLLKVGAGHQYNGDSLGVGARVLEQMTGVVLPQLYKTCLLEPLGAEHLVATNTSWDAQATAFDLARFGQMLANRGAYGDFRFFSEQTFEKMLPATLDSLLGKKQPIEWGIGLTWFGDQVVGHGSATSCTLRVDLKNDLVITMTRRAAGRNFGKYHNQFIRTVEDSIAGPMVHPLFADHMVLQRGKPTPIWGTTTPGGEVRVTIAGKTAVAVADASGKWRAEIGPLEPGGPRQLKVEAHETVEFNDVLVGDVWICSGQSNMEWPVRRSNNADQEVAAADHPQIRLLSVPNRTAMQPEQLLGATWRVCSPESIPDFSAVGYFFGRHLQEQIEVPIGLIDATWGGTRAEAWTSADGLADLPDFREALENLQQERRQQGRGPNYRQLIEAWWQRNKNDGNAQQLKNPAFDDRQWSEMALPGTWERADAGLDRFDGVVWYRREFHLPEDWAGSDAKLSLGPVDDVDTTWVNGRRVGSMFQWNLPRIYDVPAKYLKPGRNVVAIRIYDNMGEGGFAGKPEQLALHRADDSEATISLAGLWRYHVAARKDELRPFPESSANHPNLVTVLYNGMIAPLTPYGVKGVIWYQGEANAGRPDQYRRLLPALIADWRRQFGQGDFPFLIVQLANFKQRQQKPVESGWAELREAQAQTAAADPNVGLAVITDIGAADDIHPRNKQEVGRRLALAALRIAYEHPVVDQGPTFREMQRDGRQIVLRFDGVGSGLKFAGDQVRGFAVAGQDGQFHWADARIEKEAVVVSSDQVAEPTAVRYNWADNPLGTLANQEGLPAAPFRTDRPQ